MSFRSPETLKKEYALQAERTVRMNLALQTHSYIDGSTYKETLEDLAVFANEVRKVAPEPCLVVLHDNLRVDLFTDEEDYSIKIYMNGNCWGYEVNGTTNYKLDDGEKVGPTRLLKKAWDAILPKLPENFIIRGVISSQNPPEEVAIREVSLKGLGFGPTQANGEVYGIMKGGSLVPMSLDEFLSLTQDTPMRLNQKMSVKKINWPGV